MAQIETWLNQDMMQAVKVRYLDGNLFSQDNAGNLIGVKLTRDGVDYSGGGTVSANVIRADGGTVAVTGALSGNVATVVLPQAAYAVPGVVSIVVKLTVSGAVATIAAVVANIYQSSTETAVDPGTIIPSIQTLIDQIDTAVASIPADYSSLWETLAPAFSTSTAYAVGQYVTYNGGLYRFTADHAAGAWSSSDVSAAVLGNELSDLKNAFEFEANTAIPAWIMDQTYNTPSSVTSKLPNDLTPTVGYACTYLECTAGDVFYITGHGGSGSKLWNWTQSDGTIISRANSTAVLNNAKLTAPENSAYLLVSVDTAYDYFLIKGASVNERIDTTKKLVMFREIGQYGKYTTEDGKINLLSALRAIPGKEMSSAVFYTTSIFNYESLATSLEISTLFEPLRVRDESGNQITAIYCRLDPAAYKTAIVAYGYKADGSNDRPYRADDVTNGILGIDSTTYYLVLHQYSNLDLLIGTEAPSIAAEYHVGSGREYTSFHDCLVALRGDDSQKTIHVYGGTYDILDEMGGAEFLAGLSVSDNWYDVCDIIPPNTHIIGHGNVIFDLTIPSGTSADIAVLLSPINMMGSATIENVTINCDGGRYCIHAEGERMTAYNNAVWRIINCKINKSNNLTGVANAIGVGINNGDFLEIRDCVITNDGNAGLLVHDQQNTAGGFAVSPRILVVGCAIDVSAYPIVMSSTHSGTVSGAVLEMTVVNCYVGNKFMRKIGSGNADVFHATYINTPHRIQNGDGLLDIIPDTDYNNFSLS